MSISFDGLKLIQASPNSLPSAVVITVDGVPSDMVTLATVHGGEMVLELLASGLMMWGCGVSLLSSGWCAFGVPLSFLRSSSKAAFISSVSCGVPCQLMSSYPLCAG